MKIAVVYNRESNHVINLFGIPNREKIGRQTIERLTNALKAGGHQVIALEGDKNLIDRLEDFMPRVVKNERPGMVFNVSYGIQGQARYTHVPSILEMVGIPYVASGPLAHSLALDKVVTKMILRQHGLPTPDFAVLERPDVELPELVYPIVVKPKNEAVSFGLRVVRDEAELREGAAVIFEKFGQAVLAEQYVEGREVNVGILGNSPPEAFPPVQLEFGNEGPAIYTYEDKTGQSGRTIGHSCPAPIGDELLEQAKTIAVRAFTALGCCDCARVDMRLDADGRLYILEVNSLPSLGEHGSYLIGAAAVGLDFASFVNRLVEVAAARYFGTPDPPQLDREATDPSTQAFSYLTQRRDRIETRLREWVRLSSRTSDLVGLQEAVRRAGRLATDLKLKPVEALSDERSVHVWESSAGLDDGILLVGHLDVPLSPDTSSSGFRRTPEWIEGEGVASSRAPLVMLEFALRAVRQQRRLHKLKLGVLLYTDEGADCRYSGKLIREAMSRAGEVLVLRPATEADAVVVRRRGQRKLQLVAATAPQRPGQARRRPDLLRWLGARIEAVAQLGSTKDSTSISALSINSEAYPMLLPHRATVTILLTYPDAATGDRLEETMREALAGPGPKWNLEQISDRPPLTERSRSQKLGRRLQQVAKTWDIRLRTRSSSWPSAAGLAPDTVPTVCGVGPYAHNMHTPGEGVQRIALIQRTLLLTQYLLTERKNSRR